MCRSVPTPSSASPVACPTSNGAERPGGDVGVDMTGRNSCQAHPHTPWNRPPEDLVHVGATNTETNVARSSITPSSTDRGRSESTATEINRPFS
jgi:hypothetical protein